MTDKTPIVTFEEEQVRFENSEVQYIGRVFITQYGKGNRGIWEYAKSKDPKAVFLNTVLLIKDSSNKDISVIVKKELEPCTHEGKALTSFNFQTISEDDDLDTLSQAKAREFGISETKVVTKSPSAYYTDPWKSDQRVMTIVLETEQNVDVQKLKELDQSEETICYFKISIKDGAQGLIDLALREECAIDCDLY